jgi:hypothetical protein
MTYANLIRHCAALIVALSGAAAMNVAVAADTPRAPPARRPATSSPARVR